MPRRLLLAACAAVIAVVTRATEVCLWPDATGLHATIGSVDPYQSGGLATKTLSGVQDVYSEYVEALLTSAGSFDGTVQFAIPSNLSPTQVSQVVMRVNFQGERGTSSSELWRLQVRKTSGGSWETIWDNTGVNAWQWTETSRLTSLTSALSAYVQSSGKVEVRVLAASNNNENGLFDSIVLCLQAPQTSTQRPTTASPTQRPTVPITQRPTTRQPTVRPTVAVTLRPSHQPTNTPTQRPSTPTEAPTTSENRVPYSQCAVPESLRADRGRTGTGQGARNLQQRGDGRTVQFIPVSTADDDGRTSAFVMDLAVGAVPYPPEAGLITWRFRGQPVETQLWTFELYDFALDNWEPAASTTGGTPNNAWTLLEERAPLFMDVVNSSYVSAQGKARLRFSSFDGSASSRLDYVQLCVEGIYVEAPIVDE